MDTARQTKLSTSAKSGLGFGAALVLLAVVSALSVGTMRRLDERVRWQTHSHQVLEAGLRVISTIYSVESAHRGYVAVGDEHFLDEYSAASDSLFESVDSMDTLTADNPAQQERIVELRSYIAPRVHYLDSTNSLRRAGETNAALDAIRKGSVSALRDSVRFFVARIAAEERKLLVQREADVDRTIRHTYWISIAAVIAAALLVLLTTMAVRRDLAARRRVRAALTESETRLRDFLDSASDLIQSSDAEGRLTYVNRALIDTLGYEEHELLGKPSIMLFAPEARAHGDALFRKLLSGEPLHDIQTIYMRKDERRVHVVGSSNFRFEEGVPVESRTILHDVTRQREVDHMKEEFISIVSHELRTPLTSIRGALGLLAGGMLGEVPERGKRMLDVAITNTDRLVRLINDILDVERIESGKVPMARKRIRLTDVIGNTEELMRPVVEHAGLKLEINSLEAELNADADRLVQTLTNLIGNAVKFSPKESTIRVLCEREDDRVHIRVIDEGRGIPGDKLEQIFERFHQVDASDARDKGGSGLGLAISRGIVEQHDGRIWAESELNSGTTFHVVLPLLAAARQLPEEARAPLASASPLVLICDDDADVRMVLKAMLARQGYRVIEAADGETAIQLAAKHRPAVVLLDLIMPNGLDGWATMSRLKENPDTCDIPIVIVSGSTDHDMQQELVRKPVDPGELVHAVEHALTRWGAGANVLVVEDDEDLARILVEFLHSHGLHTLHAKDGHEAVRMSQQIPPSLIILDLMLPDRDGLAVVDWLRQHDRLREVPIMVYTARDLDDEQRTRLGVAPEFLFTKSRMAPEDLVERVAALVGRITWNQDNA